MLNKSTVKKTGLIRYWNEYDIIHLNYNKHIKQQKQMLALVIVNSAIRVVGNNNLLKNRHYFLLTLVYL